MKNLVISCVGGNSLHPIWCKKNDIFDVVLIHYENESFNQVEPSDSDNIAHIYESGSKFQLYQSYLNKYGLEYDYYLFIDDDVKISHDDICKLFELAQQHELKVFHPSIAPLNYRYDLLFKQPNSILRYVNWLELMCVGFSKTTLEQLYGYFDENLSGYGYPNLWYQLLNDLYAFACIDLVEIIHTRAVGSGINTIYNHCGSVQRAVDELHELFIKYSLPKTELKTLKRIHQRPILSCVVLYNDDDEHFLNDCLSTLPLYAELILFKSVPGDNYSIENVEVNESYIKGVYVYPKDQPFHFSRARNTIASYARGDYLFFIDPDERMLIHQHESIYQTLIYLYNNIKIAGVVFNIMSCQPEFNEENQIEKYTPFLSQTVRLARKGIEFSAGAHESLEYDIKDKNLEILYSTYKLDHQGYELDKKKKISKAKRNVQSLLLTPELVLNNPQHLKLLCRDASYYYNNIDEENANGI